MLFTTGPLRSIALIKKLHGYQGHLKVAKYEQINFKNMESVFISMEGKPVPFFFTVISESDEFAILQFDGIHKEQEAKELTNKELLVKASEEADIQSLDLKGYTCQLPNKQFIGVIRSIESYPSQEMITFRDNNLLIPLVDEFIAEVDHEKQQLILNLPDGFLDI